MSLRDAAIREMSAWPGRRVWVDSAAPGNRGVVVYVDIARVEPPFAVVRLEDGAVTSVPASGEGKRWGFEADLWGG
jgi:hypothetical protein